MSLNLGGRLIKEGLSCPLFPPRQWLQLICLMSPAAAQKTAAALTIASVKEVRYAAATKTKKIKRLRLWWLF